MTGYFVSFFLTHLLNFILSIRLLLKTTGMKIPLHQSLLSLTSMACSIFIAMWAKTAFFTALSYPVILSCFLFLFGVLCKEDLRWLKGLIRQKSSSFQCI